LLGFYGIFEIFLLADMKKLNFIAFVLIFAACNKEAERQAIIDAAIKEKVSDFQEKKLIAFRKSEFEEATRLADSILLLNADLWQLSMDSLGARPARVTKPKTPTTIVPIDSTPINPLFPLKNIK
jgi:hypothetical protein